MSTKVHAIDSTARVKHSCSNEDFQYPDGLATKNDSRHGDSVHIPEPSARVSATLLASQNHPWRHSSSSVCPIGLRKLVAPRCEAKPAFPTRLL